VNPEAPTIALAAAAALHAGFQLVVTVVVYPAFARVRPQDWPAHHRAHSRRISVVVAFVYALLVSTCVWALWEGFGGVATSVAVVANAVAVLVTAAVAAPAHSRMAGARGERDLTVLLVADRVRCAAALLGAVAATWAAVA